MHSTTRALLIRAKVAIICSIPLAAYGGQQTVRAFEVSSLSGITWGFVAGFSMLGWAVADLDKVAELWNPADQGSPYQRWKARLALLKTICASIAAGIFTFFIGKLMPDFLVGMMGLQLAGASPQVPEMLLFIFTAGAGYMGARWFDWLEKRLFK